MSTKLKHELGRRRRVAVRSRAWQASPAGSYDPARPAATDAQAASEPALAAADDVLDVPGAMRLLRIGRNTLYELVNRNEIPHRRLGKQIRFSRAAIMRWFNSWSSQDAKERQ